MLTPRAAFCSWGAAGGECRLNGCRNGGRSGGAKPNTPGFPNGVLRSKLNSNFGAVCRPHCARPWPVHQTTICTMAQPKIQMTYIPHIGDAIWREFPRLVWRPIRLVRDAEQVEQLTLQLGELRVEDLDGAAVAHEHVPLGEAE